MELIAELMPEGANNFYINLKTWTKLDIEVLSRFHGGLEDSTVWLNTRLVNFQAVALNKDI